MIDVGLWTLSFFALWLILKLTWRPGEFAAMSFFVGYQWIELSTPLWASAATGTDVDHFYATGGNVRLAIFLGLIATIAMAFGMRIGAGSVRKSAAIRLRGASQRFPLKSFYRLYIIAIGVAFAAEVAATIISGLAQGFFALESFKWAGFTLLTFAVFQVPGRKRVWTILLIASILVSLGSFFSSFKWALIYAFLGIAAAGPKIDRKRFAAMAAIALVAVLMGTVWQTIKPNYREFVSGGTMEQRVVTRWSDNVSFIYRAASNSSPDALAKGFSSLVSRVAVIDMFAATLDHIPSISPHTKGQFWTKAVSYPLMPRLLFPDKPPLDDSATTRELTGLSVAGADQHVSISTGYIAEAYADFGIPFMFFPILLTGIAFGYIYRLLSYNKDPTRALIGSAMSCVIFIPGSSVAISSVKVVSAVMIGTIAALFVQFFSHFMLTHPSRRIYKERRQPCTPRVSVERSNGSL